MPCVEICILAAGFGQVAADDRRTTEGNPNILVLRGDSLVHLRYPRSTGPQGACHMQTHRLKHLIPGWPAIPHPDILQPVARRLEPGKLLSKRFRFGAGANALIQQHFAAKGSEFTEGWSQLGRLLAMLSIGLGTGCGTRTLSAGTVASGSTLVTKMCMNIWFSACSPVIRHNWVPSLSSHTFTLPAAMSRLRSAMSSVSV